MMDKRDYNVAVITYADEDSGITFRWHGGAYIDICANGEAFDVINVWDNRLDISTFETAAMKATDAGGGYLDRRPFRFILEAFEDRCKAWASESGADPYCNHDPAAVVFGVCECGAVLTR